MFALPMFPALHSGSQGFKLLVVFQPIKMIKAILKKEKKKKPWSISRKNVFHLVMSTKFEALLY